MEVKPTGNQNFITSCSIERNLHSDMELGPIKEIQKRFNEQVKDFSPIGKNVQDIANHKAQIIKIEKDLSSVEAKGNINSLIRKEMLSEVKKALSLADKCIRNATDVTNIDRELKISEILKNQYFDIRELIIGKITKFINNKIFLGGAPNRLRDEYLEKYSSIENLHKMIKESPDTDKIETFKKDLNSWLEINYYKEKAMETRNLMKDLGGSHLKLKTKTGDLVDGMFINAGKFRQKLIDCDAGQITISTQSGKPLRGLVLSNIEGEKSEEIISSLKQFGAISSLKKYLDGDDTSLVGWCKIEINSEIYLIEKSDIQRLDKTQKNELRRNPMGYILNSPSVEKALPELPKEAGTAFINSGNMGVYEMHKSDATYFLMRGMNVAFVNPPGYGDSGGKASARGHIAAVNAMYDYISKEQKIPDEKILIKGLCLGGGASSHIAAKHPNVNIVLDQTYANFSSFVLDQIVQKLPKNNEMAAKVGKLLRSSKAPQIILNLIADTGLFATNKKLLDNNAKKLFIYSDKDTLTTSKEFERIMSKQNKHHKGKDISLMRIPGTHAQSWNNVKERQLNDDLIESNKKLQQAKKEFHDEIDNALFPEIEKLDNEHREKIYKEIENTFAKEGANNALKVFFETKDQTDALINNEIFAKILANYREIKLAYIDYSNSSNEKLLLEEQYSEESIGIQAMDRFLQKAGLIESER